MPTAHHVAGLFLRLLADLEPWQKAFLQRLTAIDVAMATAYRLIQDFTTMVRERQSGRLDGWLAAADACDLPTLRRFAQGLRNGEDALRAGLREVRFAVIALLLMRAGRRLRHTKRALARPHRATPYRVPGVVLIKPGKLGETG